MKDALFRLVNFLKKHKTLIILLTILALHVFTRFYQLETRLGFGWDQVDNAWAAKNIIIDHKFPLVGMVAKGNSGFNIGPLYYYFVAIFYWIFNLNPIASGYIAGVTSIFTFFVIFYVVKKLFSSSIALIAVGVYVISNFIILSDRSQWPVNFIAPISFLIFYFLYNVLVGEMKYLLLLALAIGISFSVHFTAVFYPIIVLFCLPFLPRNQKTIKYILLSLPVFLIFLAPNYIANISSENSQIDNITFYLNVYYHGFHLTRILQLTHDAFIEFQLIMMGWFHDMNYLLPIAFSVVYFFLKPTRKKLIMCYLIGLWFIVPWFVFAIYKGEISNYYFFSTRPVAILILAYLTYWLSSIKNYLPKIVILAFWCYFSYVNMIQFLAPRPGGLQGHIQNAKNAIKNGQFIDAYPYTPESYLYYYYSRNKK